MKPPPNTMAEAGTLFQLERRVGVEKSRLGEPRHQRRLNDASGRDDELVGPQDGVVSDLQFVRRYERRAPAIQRELRDTLDAVVGELFDELALAPQDVRHIDGHAADVNAQRTGFARILRGVAGCEECLARHAAAQDAQAAERSVIDERGTAAEIADRTGGGVAARTGTDDDEVVLEGLHAIGAPTAPKGGHQNGGSIR